MTHHWRIATFAVLSIVCCSAQLSAATLRCQSLNGNVNCAGSGGVSCQTVDGHKVCSNGDGSAVQSFGNSVPSDLSDDEGGTEGWEHLPPTGVTKERLEQRSPHGHTLRFERDGANVHLRTDRLSIDRD